MADISQIELPDGNTYDLKDANATDTKVTQTQDDSTDSNFEVLLAGSTSTSTITEEAKKSATLKLNPYKASLMEGYHTTASGGYSHAEGYYTTASGFYSHTEGYYTTASNYLTHAEGDHTIASNTGAHTEGYYTTASGNFSHVEGRYTISNHLSQHVFGEYNIEDDSIATSDKRGNYVEIVGNGTKTNDVVTRSNARTLDWDGNEILAGKLTLGAAPTQNMDATTKLYVDTGLGGKQDTLTAGSNITINANNEISAVDTNTTYTLTVSGNNIILTPSSGSANTITVPYATNAGTVNSHSVDTDVPSNAVFTDNDTKNTAGSTNTSSKIYLIGATSQAANPQTYSHDTAYVGTDGCLYSGSTKVLTAHQDISGKVSKSGDTMSGELTMNNVNAIVKDTNISTGSNPSSDVWGNGFILYENGGANIGHFRAVKLTSGDQGLQLEAQRVVSGSTKYNALNLYIDTSGNAVVDISGTGAAASWRSAIGAVRKRWVSLTGSSLLAKNAVGNTVSLSENLNNFQFLAIRWGADTDQAAGGGQFWQYIPTANCGTNSQHGFTYQNNGTVAYPTIQFTSTTALKILHTRVGTTSGGTLPGNGLRAVYGVNY